MTDASPLKAWAASGALGTLADARVLIVLWEDHRASGEGPHPTLAELAKASGMSPSGTRKALARLEAAGALTRAGKVGTSIMWRLEPCPFAPGEGVRTTRAVNSGPPQSDPRGDTLESNLTHGVTHSDRSDLSHGVTHCHPICPTGWHIDDPRGDTFNDSADLALGLAGHASLSPMTHREPEEPAVESMSAPEPAELVSGDTEGSWSLTPPPTEAELAAKAGPPPVPDELVTTVLETMRAGWIWMVNDPRRKGGGPKDTAANRKLIRKTTREMEATLEDWQHVISAQAVDLTHKPAKQRYMRLETICRRETWSARLATPLEEHQLLPWERPASASPYAITDGPVPF